MKSLIIKTESKPQRNLVVEHFLLKGYTLVEKLDDGLAVFVVPDGKGLLVTFNSVADDNAKEGYAMISFEAFNTITG